MRKIALLICCSIFLFNCEEVVEIDVPTGTPKLVIEALFEVYFDEIPVTTEAIVKLRLSAGYFDEELPVVTNAIVTLKNLSTNTFISFEDGDLDGNYIPTSAFTPEDDVVYELSVTYNNEIYKGKTIKSKTPLFINVEQGTKTLFSGNETEVIVEFSDNELENNFYLFDFSNNLYLSIEDRFFNGSDYNFSFFYQEEEVEIPSEVMIKMAGVSQDYYTYFRVLTNQSGQSGGGPFQTTPSSLLGNIINTSNTNHYPLGYFNISETATYTLSLTE